MNARRIDDEEEDGHLDTVKNVVCGYVRQGESNELTMRQIAILVQIASGAKGMSEIGVELGLTRPAVSRAVDVLERMKYAKRISKGKFKTVHATQIGSARVGRLISNVTGKG